MRYAWFAAAVCLSAVLVPGPRMKACDGFLPPNDLSISIGSAEDKGITKEQFDEVMDQVERIYAPIIQARGGKFVLERDWENSTVNAYATQRNGDWIIHMYGGLARHETITQDGMALVACHEIGHHIGGFPKGWWASNEGQSDYFANSKCLRRLFLDSGTKSFTRMEGEDPVAVKACAASFSTERDRAACARGAMAGKSVSRLFKVLRRETKEPAFDTPDPNKVPRTADAHPATQCRMDTYYQGSLCLKPFAEDFGDREYKTGACTRAGGFAAGIRPRCWFKPPAEEPELEPGLWSAAAASSSKALREGPAFKTLNASNPWNGL